MKIKSLSIVAVACLLMSACGESKKNDGGMSARELISNPATANDPSGVDPNAKVPVFSFEETLHDFGTIASGDKVNHVFKFTNTGEVPLVIQNASASCGCTVPEWPKEPIPPGGTGEIKVEFDSKGKSGLQNKTITIVANTQPNTTNLEIRGTVNPPPAEAPTK